MALQGLCKLQPTFNHHHTLPTRDETTGISNKLQVVLAFRGWTTILFFIGSLLGCIKQILYMYIKCTGGSN